MGRRKYPIVKCQVCGLPVSQTYLSRHYAKYHMSEDPSVNNKDNTVESSE